MRRLTLSDLLEGEAPRTMRSAMREDPCAYCCGPGESWDHIEPVAHGGSGAITNAARSCQHCNNRKGSQSLVLFLAQNDSRRQQWRRWRRRMRAGENLAVTLAQVAPAKIVRVRDQVERRALRLARRHGWL